MLRKILCAGLSFMLASSVIGAGVFTASASEERESVSPITLTTENAELFLPSSYEQYLPLEEPTYMAMNEKYIAIADGTLLYVYDKAEGEYISYDASDLTLSSKISKIQFSDYGQLLFSSKNGRIYLYDFENNSAKIIPNVPCSTFITVGDYLYVSTTTDNTVSFDRYPLATIENGEGQEIIVEVESSAVSKLSYADGKLYCVRSNQTIVTYDVTQAKPIRVGENEFLDNKTDAIADLQFVCAYNGYLYYTVNGERSYTNGLYRTDFTGNAELMIEGAGFSAINSYNGKLYCIQGKSVLRLEVSSNGVTPSLYEISSASRAVNRLMNGTDSVRAGNLLVMADSGADRVSVYNFAKNEYSVIDCGFMPALVATDGEVIAVASGSRVYSCKYGETSFTLRFDSNAAAIKGIACVYGSVYFVTGGSMYGRIDEEGNFNESELVWHDNAGGSIPKRLTRDIYGMLYVSYEDGSVYSFTEDEYLSKDSAGAQKESISGNYSVIRADFEGNIYYLSGSTVYKNGEAFVSVNGNDFIFHAGDDVVNPVNFALGFEDSEVYFLFGDFVVKSKADVLDIPTLNKISTEDAVETVFAVHEIPDGLLVDIPAKTVGILTELSAMREENPAYFPYNGYFRLTENVRGILLAETSNYMLVLFPAAKGYTANLFLKNEDYLIDSSEYWIADEEEAFFLSSAVSAYFAPCLDTALIDASLARGTSVKVLGYIFAPDFEYALVSYTDSARAEKTGYVPKSFLTLTPTLSVEGGSYLPVYVKANDEGIVFTAANGDTVTITERTAAKAVENGDGTYTVTIEQDGQTYSASLKSSALDWNKSDALRIALIVILTVVALVIIGVYVYMLPRKTVGIPKRKKERRKK